MAGAVIVICRRVRQGVLLMPGAGGQLHQSLDQLRMRIASSLFAMGVSAGVSRSHEFVMSRSHAVMVCAIVRVV